jgi:hypothetical protein
LRVCLVNIYDWLSIYNEFSLLHPDFFWIKMQTILIRHVIITIYWYRICNFFLDWSPSSFSSKIVDCCCMIIEYLSLLNGLPFIHNWFNCGKSFRMRSMSKSTKITFYIDLIKMIIISKIKYLST